MFGDVFKMRADYSKGLFYQSRNKFLGGDSNPLEPPSEFKTKKQAKKSLQHTTLKNKNLFQQMNFKINQDDGESLAISNARKIEASKRLKKQNAPTTIILEKFSSILQSDWEERIEAGCKLWVNHQTGEVSNECPWADDNPETSVHFPSIMTPRQMLKVSSKSSLFQQQNSANFQRQISSPKVSSPTSMQTDSHPSTPTPSTPSSRKSSSSSPTTSSSSSSLNSSSSISSSSSSSSSSSTIPPPSLPCIITHSVPDFAGTGALVYDSNSVDVQELFLFLDQEEVKSKERKEKSKKK